MGRRGTSWCLHCTTEFIGTRRQAIWAFFMSSCLHVFISHLHVDRANDIGVDLILIIYLSLCQHCGHRRSFRNSYDRQDDDDASKAEAAT